MSLRICVSYEHPEELEAVDRQLRKVQSWKVSDAPSQGRYARRYYKPPDLKKTPSTPPSISEKRLTNAE